MDHNSTQDNGRNDYGLSCTKQDLKSSRTYSINTHFCSMTRPGLGDCSPLGWVLDTSGKHHMAFFCLPQLLLCTQDTDGSSPKEVSSSECLLSTTESMLRNLILHQRALCGYNPDITWSAHRNQGRDLLMAVLFAFNFKVKEIILKQLQN